jgi:hypothetical protein
MHVVQFFVVPIVVAATAGAAAAAPATARPIDVYLIGGQSNATGQGYMRNLPAGWVPDQRVLLFNSGRPHLDSGAAPFTWLPLRQASESPDRFGPELGFGNRIQELYPDRRIALIKHAHSGTSLYHDWYPGVDAADRVNWGSQFIVFVDTVDAGLKALREQGLKPTIRGMIWQQGENDTADGPSAAYGANLAHFISRVRAQFQCPDMAFVYGYVLPPPNTGAGRARVRAGEKAVDQDSGDALSVRGAFVVNTDDLSQRANDPNTPYPQDHLHFGTAGMLELGRRMADRMQAALGTLPAQK